MLEENLIPNEQFLQIETPRLTLPLLPSEALKFYEVRGQSNIPYYVDLTSFSCTCPDWMEERVRFEFPDIRRACKHICWSLHMGELANFLPIPPCDYRIGAFAIGTQ